ncbi:MAG: glycosyltransferase family protein [Bacteroidota bacterium]
MKTAVIVQARTGSTRLPHKVLMPLAGEPLLRRMVERVQASTAPDAVVVATTTERGDDPIRDLCRQMAVECFSGDSTDLLDRHYRAAQRERADVVVKIPSDCPLIDPAIIDRVLTCFTENRNSYDFVSNLHPATYPDGNDVEAMTFSSLEMSWKEARKDFEREHTTPFIWERPDRFRIGNVVWETGLNYSMSHRWTVDYPEDYEFAKAVYSELWTDEKPVFSLHDILDLLAKRPDIVALNSRYAGINWYRDHLDELKTVTPEETKR